MGSFHKPGDTVRDGTNDVGRHVCHSPVDLGIFELVDGPRVHETREDVDCTFGDVTRLKPDGSVAAGRRHDRNCVLFAMVGALVVQHDHDGPKAIRVGVF